MYSVVLLISAIFVMIFGLFIVFIPGKPTTESKIAGFGIASFGIFMIMLNFFIEPEDHKTKKALKLLQS